jgi:hypothetical protein
LQSIERKPSREILQDYTKKGGDQRLIILILWQLEAGGVTKYDPLDELRVREWPRSKVRKLKVRIRRLQASVRAVHALYPPGWWQTLHTFDSQLSAWLKNITGAGSRRAGRAGGTTIESLVSALLVEVFSRVYGRPCYKQVLELLKGVGPQQFPSTTTIEHIRDRIRRVRKSEVEDALKKLEWLVPAVNRTAPAHP